VGPRPARRAGRREHRQGHRRGHRPVPSQVDLRRRHPCDANDAPATCPGPGFPPNFLGQLNPWTGKITKVDLRGATFGPQGMVFIGPGWSVMPG